MRKLHEITEILLKSGFVNLKISDKSINDIKFLPLGSIFLNKIKNEWYHDRGSINTYLIPNNNNCNFTKLNLENYSYIKSDKFHRNFMYVKENFQKEIPLAIKEELNCSNIENVNENNENNLKINFNNNTLLTCTYFVNEQSAIEYFYKIQRERKIWWMKLSSNPGRYFLTDLKSNLINGSNNLKMQSIKIKSKYENGILELENIQMIPLKGLKLEKQNEFYLKDTRLNKRIIPAIIRTELPLQTAVTGLLFDSIENTKSGKMNISRKIAPYQCALLCLSEDEKILSELKDLAAHLASVIRKVDISVLNLPKCYAKNNDALKNKIHEMDNIGVPYSIILETQCLQNGLMKLRSRDTTISEIIHISDIPNYLLKIFKSE